MRRTRRGRRVSSVRGDRLDGFANMSGRNSHKMRSNLKSFAFLQVFFLVAALIFDPVWCAAKCGGASCEKVVETIATGTHDAPPCHHTSQGKHKSSGVQHCAQPLYFYKQNSTSVPDFSTIIVLARVSTNLGVPELTAPAAPKRSSPPGIAFQAPSILRI